MDGVEQATDTNHPRGRKILSMRAACVELAALWTCGTPRTGPHLGHLGRGKPRAPRAQRPERSELNTHSDQVQSAASAIATKYTGELGVPLQHTQRPSPERSGLNTRSGRVQSAASSKHAAAESRAQRAQPTQRPRFAPATRLGSWTRRRRPWWPQGGWVRLWTGSRRKQTYIIPGVEKFCRCGLRVLSSLRSGLAAHLGWDHTSDTADAAHFGHLGPSVQSAASSTRTATKSRAQRAQHMQRPSPERSELNTRSGHGSRLRLDWGVGCGGGGGPGGFGRARRGRDRH